MIEIKNLQKKFGTLEVLSNIHIQIQDGEIYGLVGRSGAGKSTLLRCINGLENYEVGSLKVNGTEVNSLDKKALRKFRKEIGMKSLVHYLVGRSSVWQLQGHCQ